MKYKDLIGKKFFRLTIVDIIKKQRYKKNGAKDGSDYFCKCLCDCGAEKIVELRHLKSGVIKSCGCYRSSIISKMFLKHNKKNTRLYRVWKNMKQRCYNKNSEKYKNYGLRGITICDEWKNDFVCFYNWAIKNGYDETKSWKENSIDRIDTNGDYCPENCRWVTMKEQAKNKTKTVYVYYRGKNVKLKDISEKLGIDYMLLHGRLKIGWGIEKAISEPKNGNSLKGRK